MKSTVRRLLGFHDLDQAIRKAQKVNRKARAASMARPNDEAARQQATAALENLNYLSDLRKEQGGDALAPIDWGHFAGTVLGLITIVVLVAYAAHIGLLSAFAQAL